MIFYFVKIESKNLHKIPILPQKNKQLRSVYMSKKITLVDQIYLNIKEDIGNKVLFPGQKINVKELSRKYEVSDTPVKQALNRLISDHMVISVPNKGMSVRHVSIEELDEVFDMRLMMDLYFMKDILSTFSYNKILQEQMRKNIQEHSAFVEKITADNHQSSTFYNYDSAFHELYLTGSGNQKVIETFRNLNPFMYSSYAYMQQPQLRNIECIEEHQAIFDAILRQNQEELKTAIENHILNTKKTMHLIFKVNQIL